MELEELKAVWQSVKPEIKSVGYYQKDRGSISNKIDIRTRLLRKLFLGESFSAVCLILLATSRLWSPTKFSILWLALFCSIIFIALLCGMRLFFAIRNINLWDDSNSEILSAVVRVKRLYRRIELVSCVLVLPLLVWLSLTPPFIYTIDMYICWGLTIVCFGIEYIWYRSNVKQINKLSNWGED